MLFTRPTLICYISQGQLVLDSKESVMWDSESLVKVLDPYLSKFDSGNIHLILGPDTSYTIHLPKPQGAPTRELIYTTLTGYIPENFEVTQFDWRLLHDGLIEAIVIKKHIFQALLSLKDAFPKLNFESQSALSILLESASLDKEEWLTAKVITDLCIHAVNGLPSDLLYQAEPKTGAKLSSRDLMALARKFESDGQDEKTLDVPIYAITPKVKARHKTSFLIPKIVSVFIVLAIGSLLYMQYSKPNHQPASPEPSSVAIESPAPSPVPTASDFSIIISNGSGKSGEAGRYRELLLASGFENVIATTSSTILDQSQIYLKDALPNEIQEKLLQTIAPFNPGISINSESISDVFISIGTN